MILSLKTRRPSPARLRKEAIQKAAARNSRKGGTTCIKVCTLIN